jgi:hypothetical protein
MSTFKTLSAAAAFCGLALTAAFPAHAQGATTGSTDIYSTDFQKVFQTVRAGSQAPAAAGTGSTDIYATDFQRVFGTQESTTRAQQTAAASGSTDIYTTDFQKASL